MQCTRDEEITKQKLENNSLILEAIIEKGKQKLALALAALKDSSSDKEESKPELPEFDKVYELIDSEFKERSEEIERNREVNLKKLNKFKKEIQK